jgi:four helix bundle protein
MNHKDLDVWKKAMDLAEGVYQVTRTFPKEETYGLTSQARRAAVSVPSNLSEGAARPSRKEFQLFIGYALGSLAELETQLLLAQRLSYLSETPVFCKNDQVRAMLLGLRRSLKARNA